MLREIAATFIGISLFLTGCASDSTTKEQDYEQTKKMVVDILKTNEGEKTLQEILTKEDMKEQLVIGSDTVKKAITEAFESENVTKMWTTLFEDADFIKVYTESISEEQKKLLKGLMHDADFQKQFIEILQNPEITEQTLTLLKSQQFREHLEKTIKETLDSPLYKAKIEDILLKAADKKGKDEEAEK